MRLLIVDDSALIRLQVRKIVEEFGYIEIDEAKDGIEALDKHRIFKPHIIVLDYIIPAPDGLALLKIMAKIDKKVKIILLTSLAKQKLIYKGCIEYGAYAILSKPINRESMLRIIEDIRNN